MTKMEDGIRSPCINLCRLDPATGWCEGCLRTLDEITGWSELDDEAKRAVWQRIARRRAQLDPTAGVGA